MIQVKQSKTGKETSIPSFKPFLKKERYLNQCETVDMKSLEHHARNSAGLAFVLVTYSKAAYLGGGRCLKSAPQFERRYQNFHRGI